MEEYRYRLKLKKQNEQCAKDLDAFSKPTAKCGTQRVREHHQLKKLVNQSIISNKINRPTIQNNEYKKITLLPDVRSKKPIYEGFSECCMDYRPSLSNKISNVSCAKTPAQRSKEYRERLKLKKINPNTSSKLKPPPKSGAQRVREYRQRKKLLIQNILKNHGCSIEPITPTELFCKAQLKDESEFKSKSTDTFFETIYLPIIKEEIQDNEYKENLL